MAQTIVGAAKVMAKKTGETLESYLAKREAGFKWCWRCRSWKATDQFNIDRSRHDGRCTECNECRHVSKRLKRIPMEDRRAVQKAHDAIRWATKRGQLRPARELFCKCGSPATHYHHHNGYAGHELDVIPLCFSCHKRAHYGNAA